MSNNNYPWDPYSDQPHILKDKAFKRSLYKKGALSSLKTLLYIPIIPFIALKLLFVKRFKVGQHIENIGLAVNLKEEMEGQTSLSHTDLVKYVNELGVENLLIRLPLSDIDNINAYIEFVDLFPNKHILLNVLQDRAHIEDHAKLTYSMDRVFSAFENKVKLIQIGNSINRKKWGFITTKEYFHFFEVCQRLRDEKFPSIALLGGNTIDFELPNFARSVFHASKIKYDGIAVQLYVDRRGAPENSQFGFDLLAKIRWFFEMTQMSRKSQNKLYITETNWPLEGTEPYAPAVGDCMVNEEQQAWYLVRYYLLAIASGRVEKCYWHQLVAPGYGLIDNRGDTVRKRKAYTCLKVLNQLLSGATVIDFRQEGKAFFSLKVRNTFGEIEVLWCNDNTRRVSRKNVKSALDILGEEIKFDTKTCEFEISDSPIYLLNYS